MMEAKGMNEEILKRLEEIEAQAAALRRACIQAKKGIGHVP